ncbi:retrotransposon protein, putative, ty1-copia subclass [Tanacetum coccineum]
MNGRSRYLAEKPSEGLMIATTVGNNSVFRSFFKKQKLTGPNFIDWYRQLRLVLSTKDKENYLEHLIPDAPVALPGQQVPLEALAAHVAWELKAMFSKQAEQELLQTVREFHTCKQEEGQSHVLKMKGYIDNLERPGQPVGQNLAVSLILVSLNKDFDSFVQNYNMHGMGKTVNELHVMLKLHEETLPKKDANPALHAIRAGRVQKNQKNKPHKAAKGGHGKGKSKMGYAPNNAPFAPKPKTPPPPKKDNPAKDAICHQCGEIGHWRRNCPVYLAELMKKKKLSNEASTSGALSLYVKNGNRAAVEAIRSYHLELPGGLVIVLNNCHYAPSITRGAISFLRLNDDGFINRFDENNVLSVSKNNLVYFVAVPRDGIFEIDMSCSNTNDSSMYNVSNKRAKINLDSSYLWHCRLGHISKKRIEKLQHEGLFNSTDIQSLGKCVSCMSGKMARKPYSHQVERAKDLLGLIHTDVCGPFKIVSRQVFQKEVENQLGKTIKSLRSDRGGKYMSQEFLDNLKKHGIIAHRTPLYTPQNNGVAERRNRTLLDIVRSMMSQTTLPKISKGNNEIFFLHPSENKVFVTRNAEFFESKLIDLKASGSVEDLEITEEEDTNPSVDTSLDHEEDDQEIDEPQNNDVWVLVELPPNARTIGSKCLFKKKTDMDGAVYVFKARFVAKGFTQTYRVDYEETFSPVADIRAIRILIAIAAYYDYEIWQIDVKTAFLNGHLSEEIYMEKPEGFVDPKYPNHVCKLKRFIYGLKQASRQWNKRFDDEIKKFGFTQNRDEPCVYLKDSESYIAILILYVDDILLMGSNISMLQDVKSYLGKCFAMKDLGDAAYILGIKIYRDRSKRLIGLCQSAYIEKILKKYSMENSKRGTIPMQEKLTLSKSQGVCKNVIQPTMAIFSTSLSYGVGLYHWLSGIILKELNCLMCILCQLHASLDALLSFCYSYVKGLFLDFESLLEKKPIDLLNMEYGPSTIYS